MKACKVHPFSNLPCALAGPFETRRLATYHLASPFSLLDIVARA